MSICKIAYILTPIDFGGAERVNLNFLKNVDRNRFQIAPIILIRPWEEDNFFIQELKKINYPIYKVPVAIRPRIEGKDYFRVIRCYRIIHSILKNNSFDLVHTHGYFADIIGIPVAKKLGIPNISTYHGFITDGRKLGIYNILNHLVLKLSNNIIAVSEEIRNILIKKGIKRKKIKVILNAVPINSNNKILAQYRKEKRKFLNVNEKEFVIGYIGRLSEEKGIKYLLEAISILNLDIPVKALIIGEGPQRKDLEDLVKERGIEEKVIFTGFQKDTENWLSVLDVFVLPSLTEGTPMALLEAMACGTPVVTANTASLPEVAGEAALLVDPYNVEALAEAMQRVLSDHELALDLRRRGFERAAQFTWERTARQTISVYQQVLEASRSVSGRTKESEYRSPGRSTAP